MYFLPQDLLSLSRTSKAFHDFLWCKSSACYWKQALERITGLPPCPKELIEPAWAAFIYWEPICTVSPARLLYQISRSDCAARNATP